VWNGPLGAFEIEPFNAATDAAALKAAELSKSGALISVAGGGDTVAALLGDETDGCFRLLRSTRSRILGDIFGFGVEKPPKSIKMALECHAIILKRERDSAIIIAL